MGNARVSTIGTEVIRNYTQPVGGNVRVSTLGIEVLRATVTLPHTIYRFVIKNLQGGTGNSNVAMAEIQLRTSIGGSDVTSTINNITNAHGDIGAAYSSEKAIDDNLTTMWNGGSNATDLANDDIWWEIDFENDLEVEIVEYIITARETYLDDTPTEWKFQKWNGAVWVTMGTEVTTGDWAASESRTFQANIFKAFKFTVSASKVPDDVVNIPVIVNLSESSGTTSLECYSFFEEMTDSDRKKVRFTSANKEIQFHAEIEPGYDFANNKVIYHVQIPNLDSIDDTVYYMFYDSTWDDNTDYIGDIGDSQAQLVYDSNFVLVHHMAQDPSGSAPQLSDSTSNGNDGTSEGTMVSGDLVDGLISKAINFDTNKRINLGNIGGGAGYENLTVEVYFKNKKADYSAYGYIVNKDASGTNAGDGSICIKDSTEKLIWRNNADLVAGAATLYDNWVYAVYTFSNPDHELFEHGISVDTSINSTTIWNNSVSLFLSNVNSTYAFEGEIGEIRISNVVRSDAWIKITDDSLKDELITIEDSTESDGLISIESVIVNTSTTSTIDNIITRNLLAVLSNISATPNIDNTGVWNLLAALSNTSITSDIQEKGAILLLVSLSNTSITSDIQISAIRNLLSALTNVSVISGIDHWRINKLITNIQNISTTSTISGKILRPLLVNLINASATTQIDKVKLLGLLVKFTNTSSTVDIEKILTHDLFAQIENISSTTSVLQLILRVLDSTIINQSFTPDEIIIILGYILINKASDMGITITQEDLNIVLSQISGIRN